MTIYQAFSPKRLTQKYLHRYCKAFTLMEMMVVVGLIAIVVAGVTPGLKRAYDEFKANETFEHVETLVAGLRTFYLIQNEIPEDVSGNLVKEDTAWILPGSYFMKTLNGSRCYSLKIKPCVGGGYDIDNWLIRGAGEFYVSIYDVGSRVETWYNLFLEKYFGVQVHLEDNQTICVPVMNGLNSYITESAALRNRYY